MIQRDPAETVHLVWKARTNGETLASIGNRIGLSREQVRQYEAKALRELKRLADIEKVGGLNQNTPLEFTGLPVRALNCCKNLGLRKVADLRSLPVGELLRTPNFGKKTLQAIEALLVQVYGQGFPKQAVRLKPEPKPKPQRKPREPRNGWLPIETAPTDGTYFLAYIPWRGVQIIRWEGNPEDLKVVWKSNSRVAIGGKPGLTPSHWMPLPGPP